MQDLEEVEWSYGRFSIVYHHDGCDLLEKYWHFLTYDTLRMSKIFFDLKRLGPYCHDKSTSTRSEIQRSQAKIELWSGKTFGMKSKVETGRVTGWLRNNNVIKNKFLINIVNKPFITDQQPMNKSHSIWISLQKQRSEKVFRRIRQHHNVLMIITKPWTSYFSQNTFVHKFVSHTKNCNRCMLGKNKKLTGSSLVKEPFYDGPKKNDNNNPIAQWGPILMVINDFFCSGWWSYVIFDIYICA